MHTDLHSIIAAQYIQDRMAGATAARQARAATGGRRSTGSRLRAAWGRVGRHTPTDPIPPTVVASLRPRRVV